MRDHLAVLAGIKRALKPLGRTVLQFGGKGNAALISDVANELTTRDRWKGFFLCRIHVPVVLLLCRRVRRASEARWPFRETRRVDRKDVVHNGTALAGWLRTVFLPYTGRLPEALREDFLEEIATTYVERRPPDENGDVHVQMVRLEVEATL